MTVKDILHSAGKCRGLQNRVLLFIYCCLVPKSDTDCLNVQESDNDWLNVQESCAVWLFRNQRLIGCLGMRC